MSQTAPAQARAGCRRHRAILALLGAVPWPADGVSVADISGIGVADGPGATPPYEPPGAP